MLKLDNDNNLSGNYPLFFSEDLGVYDSFNVTYPSISKLDEEQRAKFWKSDEFDLTQDALDMRNLEPDIAELMIRNLSFQLAGDTFVSGTLQELLFPVLSNFQAKKLISYHGDTEEVHADAYGRMVGQCFPDPNLFLERVKQDQNIIRRLDLVANAFSEHKRMCNTIGATLLERQCALLKMLAGLLGFEGIMFMASFSATFAVCNHTGKLAGIRNTISLIHDDEAGHHVPNILEFLRITLEEERESYKEAWNIVRESVTELLNSMVESELYWSDTLFEGIKSPVGFNAELLKQYVLFLAKPLYDKLGLDYSFNIVEDMPMKWLSVFTNPNKVQNANQEGEGNNYIVNGLYDDSGNYQSIVESYKL